MHKEHESTANLIERLPVLPVVVARVLALRPASDTYFDDLLRIVSEDPAFAIEVIRVANSPLVAPMSPIQTLPSAVARLGARRTASMVTAMSAIRVFVPTTDDQRELWGHALDTAVTARVIAEHSGGLVDPDEAYVAGLLHDIGRLVMFDASATELADVEAHGWVTPEDLLAAEAHLCGLDHTQRGWLVCKHWGIPEELSLVVRDHHAYGPVKRHDLLSVIQMADRVSYCSLRGGLMEAKDPAAFLQTHCVHPAWGSSPIPMAVLAARLPAIEEESQALAEDLGVALPRAKTTGPPASS
jgi:putative nucleotidyltransferase with HDIG domain